MAGGLVAKRNTPVKALLLEQSIAAGVGNIYADEALFLSGIRPDRPASGLSADEVARLRQGIIDCINAGFAVYDRVRDLPLARTAGANGNVEPSPRRQDTLPQLRGSDGIHADSGARGRGIARRARFRFHSLYPSFPRKRESSGPTA